jgi:hypothetical protein
VFVLCDDHRKQRSRRPANKQYDELYKDCKTELQIEPAMVALGHSGMKHASLDEYTDFNTSKFYEGRTDIPVPEFFMPHVKRIKGYDLQPEDIKKMWGLLHQPAKALASWEFNQTFDVEPWKAKFEEEYDMKIVEEIFQLLSKMKKVKRIK